MKLKIIATAVTATLFAATLGVVPAGAAPASAAAKKNTVVYYMDYNECKTTSQRLARDGATIVVNCSWAASGGWAYKLEYHY